MPGYNRFVAIGDSQTEGLWDGDDRTGLVGWADRFAHRLAEDSPDLLYANLAVRSRRTAEIRDEQLDIALAMQPDIVGICAGMNDITGMGSGLDEALDVLEDMYARLAASGATVLTTLFPDVRQILPVGRFIDERLHVVNDRIRLCADRYDLRLIDLFTAPSMVDLRMWSPDRLHGSPLGHERFALAAAEAVGLTGSDHSWADALDDPVESSLLGAVRRDIAWVGAVFGPWTWRRLRGTSTGAGRVAKRPVLTPVVSGSAAREHHRQR